MLCLLIALYIETAYIKDIQFINLPKFYTEKFLIVEKPIKCKYITTDVLHTITNIWQCAGVQLCRLPRQAYTVYTSGFV